MPTPERGLGVSVPIPAPIEVNLTGLSAVVMAAAAAAATTRGVRCAVLPLYGSESRRMAAQGLLWRQLQNA